MVVTARPGLQRRRAPRLTSKLVFVLPVVAALVAGVAGGLVRAGVGLPGTRWLGAAVAGHAFLMICAFMGTVIAIERAVAVKHALAFAGPLASALAGIAMLLGAASAARGLVLAASAAFVVVNVVVVRRQRAAHTVLLLVAALAWFAGCVLYALNVGAAAVVPLWLSFLVLTIAAERLEMTRLMRRRPGASRALQAILCGLLAGAALSAFEGPFGGVVFGLSLMGLATWLLRFDIARRTVHASGLSRYMATCLLLGYGWLFAAGLAWVLTTLGAACVDLALHGVALGFVFSMMLGHAPVILPAVARMKLQFGRAYYVPLVLLHASLVVRLGWGHFERPAFTAGAIGNALALLVFAFTVAGSALLWRAKNPLPRAPRRANRLEGTDRAAGR
jgi:hypothetical protein